MPAPVLLFLGGTGVSARDGADSHKHKPPGQGDKDYLFGVEGLWVVAPNRHGAHNWEGNGHKTALSAVDALAALSRAHFPGTPADRGAVLFSGPPLCSA